MSGRRRLAFWACLIVLTVGVVEVAAAAVCFALLGTHGRFLLWRPDLAVARANFVAAANDVDAELGWPRPSEAAKPPRDATGAKINVEFPGPGGACASAYGDSFIWGEEIPLADGWIEQLSHQLGCRVANYGVSGYGTDQAYQRFRRSAADDAPVTFLGIFPENIVRNVNAYRALMGHAAHPTSLKGRFVLDGKGQFKWLSRPRLDAEGFVALNRAPAEALPDEYLLPDTRDGPVTMGFPYTLTLVRVALQPRLWTRFSGRPSWSAFYEKDHASRALALTAAIAKAFASEAERRGKKPLVIMLPGASSFRGKAKYGSFEYVALVDRLAGAGIPVFDAGPALLHKVGSNGYCSLYVHPESCDGHYGVAGSEIVAEVVAVELRQRALVRR
jgi:hypothetical protein